VAKSFALEKAQFALDYSRSKLTELEKYAETGDWSWTAGANLAGGMYILQ
jgi:hypothetical protein